MKVNRSKFSKIKAQYEIQKMSAAYIHAERLIMANPGLTGFDEAISMGEGGEIIFMSGPTSPEEFNDRVAKVENMTIKDVQIMELDAKLKNMEEKGRELMDAEKFEELAELKDWYEKTKKQYEKLSGKRYES